MPSVIQHKRSTTTRDPGTLLFGELAFTANGNYLYIGNSTGGSVSVGSQRFPGALTANQSIVTNANNWLDQFNTAKLIIGTDGSATQNITSISYFANSTQLGASGAASNNEIVPSWAIKTYVDGKVSGAAGAPTGANTQIQFNDSGTFGGDAELSYDKTSNLLTVGNSTVNTVINTSSITVSTIGGTLTTFNANATFAGANVRITSSNVSIAGTSVTVTSNVNTTTTEFSVVANTQTFASNSTVNGLQIIGNSTATEVRIGSGATVTNVTSTTTNFTGAFNHSGGVYTESSNATFSGTNTHITSTNTSITGGFNHSGGVHLVSSNATFSGTNTSIGGTNTNITSTGTNIGGTTLSVSSNANFTANVTISGDLVVTGSVFTVNVDTMTVEDSIIRLATNNITTDVIDSGFYGVYGNSTVTQFAGLFRDSSNSGIWTVFNTQTEPGTTVNTGAGTYARGTLLSNFVTEVFSANSTAVSITAGALASDLTVQDGGTGAGSFTAKGLIYGNGTSALQVTAAGTDGQIMQANSTGFPVWGGLDGGTF